MSDDKPDTAHSHLLSLLEPRRSVEWTLASLTGSKYYLTPEDELIFLDLYAQLAAEQSSAPQEFLYLAEKRTPIFPYFVVFDLVDQSQILAIAKAVQQVLSQFYPQAFELVLCTAPKHGLRIFAPNLYLTAQQVLDIREQLVVHLELTFGKQWGRTADHTVYKHAALRLPFSGTVEKCPECLLNFRRKRRIRCQNPSCYRGYLPHADRAYEPLVVLGTDGQMDASETERIRDPLYLLQRTSVRYHGEATAGFRLPRGCHPSPLLALARPKDAAYDSEDEREDDIPLMDARKLSAMRKATRCELPEQVKASLLDAIHQDPRYKQVLIRQVLCVNAEPPYYLVHPRGPGSQYCFNKRGAHKHNSIYFQVTQFHIVQKCFNNSAKQRDTGVECRHYHSNRLVVPLELRKALFDV